MDRPTKSYLKTQSNGTLTAKAQQYGCPDKPTMALQEIADKSIVTEKLYQLQRIADQSVSSGINVPPKCLMPPIQMGGGKKGSKDKGAEEKLKGDDYANNVQKLINDIAALLQQSGLGEFCNDDINAQLQIINANRSKCSVSTNLVEGEDTNTAAYGALKSGIVDGMAPLTNLFGETHKSTFAKGINGVIRNIVPKLSLLAQTAIDPRVAIVINEGREGDKAALIAIDQALPLLQAALMARLKEYLQLLSERQFPSNEPKGDDEEGPPPGASGAGTGILA